MEEDDEGEFEEAIKQRQIDEPSPVNKEHLHPNQLSRQSKCVFMHREGIAEQGLHSFQRLES